MNENEKIKRDPAKSFEDLIVWQKAHEAVLVIYKLTGEFPSNEKYGLTSQFRRAAISIAANIAEGFVKKSELDKMRYLNIAQGSLEECKYYLILSADLKYGSNNQLRDLFNEIGKLLNGYISKIKANTKY